MTPNFENAENSSLAGKSAVVTGASKGIGQAIAVSLATAGADVFVHARADTDGLAQTASQVEAAGRQVATHLCDLGDPSCHAELAAAAFAWRNRIHTWVNNAGADVLTGPISDGSFEHKLQRLWEVDVRGTIGLSRLVGARMKDRGDGCLINIGWDQAMSGMAGDSGEMFATAKGAVMSFTRSLAKSLAPEVRVNCVAPGWIKTDWGRTASTAWDERAQRESLMQRWGQPADVAAAVCFLASPAAAFINGQILEVNGGFSGAELPRSVK